MSNAVASPFLLACRRQPTSVTPIWLMRQAGRYMPEYRAMRGRHRFLELCKDPKAAAEVTLQPVDRLGVDAAILFADILLVLEPLGIGLEFTRGDGPHIQRPVRSAEDVERLRPVAVDEAVPFVFETVRLAQKALFERGPPVRLPGAPVPPPADLLAGRPPRQVPPTQPFMRGEPAARPP